MAERGIIRAYYKIINQYSSMEKKLLLLENKIINLKIKFLDCH